MRVKWCLFVHVCSFLTDSNIVGGSVRESSSNPKADERDAGGSDRVHIEHMHRNPFANQQKVGWRVILNLHFGPPDLTLHL